MKPIGFLILAVVCLLIAGGIGYDESHNPRTRALFAERNAAQTEYVQKSAELYRTPLGEEVQLLRDRAYAFNASIPTRNGWVGWFASFAGVILLVLACVGWLIDRSLPHRPGFEE